MRLFVHRFLGLIFQGNRSFPMVCTATFINKWFGNICPVLENIFPVLFRRSLLRITRFKIKVGRTTFRKFNLTLSLSCTKTSQISIRCSQLCSVTECMKNLKDRSQNAGKSRFLNYLGDLIDVSFVLVNI